MFRWNLLLGSRVLAVVQAPNRATAEELVPAMEREAVQMASHRGIFVVAHYVGAY